MYPNKIDKKVKVSSVIKIMNNTADILENNFDGFNNSLKILTKKNIIKIIHK